MTKQFGLSPVLIAVVLLGGLLTYLYLPAEQEQKGRPNRETAVTVHEVQHEPFAEVIEALGTALANEAVIISVQDTEIVSDVMFSDGDVVEQGQLLLKLNNREELARVNELQVSLDEANRQYIRLKNLAQENATSEQLLDEQQARVKTLKAQIEVANAQLAELEVRAPFAGVLGIRQVSVGALVRPGDMITTLDDLETVKVDFGISEQHLQAVEVNQIVDATSVAYPDEVFRGEIVGVDSRIDPVTRAIQVRALIDNSQLKLRPGMLLTLNLEKNVSDSLVIPEKALIPNQDRQFVFVVNDQGVAHRVEVQTSGRVPGKVRIVEGLSEGDQVVLEGTMRIREGSRVTILEQ
jgi:membrane fusion protein (multidrug efflux system)